MNGFRLIKQGGAVVAAFVLAVVLAPAAQAHHCKGGHFDPEACEEDVPGGGDGGGKDKMAAGFDDSFAGLKSDELGLYVDGEPGVDVRVGGAGRRIRIDLNSDGSQGDRSFMVDAICVVVNANACSEGDFISGNFPNPDDPDSDEYAILDVFHVADMPADGKFYPKNATFHIRAPDSEGILHFRFREPKLFNLGDACSDNGSDGAGISVWVARFEDGTWFVTTETPPPGPLGGGDLTGDEAGEVACLEVQDSATGTTFGGNYSIPFAVVVGPESIFAAP